MCNKINLTMICYEPKMDEENINVSYFLIFMIDTSMHQSQNKNKNENIIKIKMIKN